MNWVVVVCSLHGNRSDHNYGYLVSSIRCHSEAAADIVCEFLMQQSASGRIDCKAIWDGEDK